MLRDERSGASGYHRRLGAAQQSIAARLVAVADCYHAFGEDRAHRPARTPAEAEAEVQAMAKAGRLDANAPASASFSVHFSPSAVGK